MIDALASLPHFRAHLQPIWDALPVDLRGRFWSPRTRPPRWVRDRLILVASLVDYQSSYPRPVVYVEHGAGQTYEGDRRSAGHGSYSGGDGMGRVRLFLCPNATVADRWAARYPHTPIRVVGSPLLDRYARDASARGMACGRCATGPSAGGRGPVVALTHHWDCRLVPETRWAFPHFEPGYERFVAEAWDRGWQVIGHGHPRAWPVLRSAWARLGVEPVESFWEVLARADVLCVDNSSVGPEFAAVSGCPLVWLNAPWYRRDVEHGGRFWVWPTGQVQCDDPSGLVEAVERALEDPVTASESRQRMVASVYPLRDGMAAERAAEAIVRLIEGGCAPEPVRSEASGASAGVAEPA